MSEPGGAAGATSYDSHAHLPGADVERSFEVQRLLGTSTHSFADATDSSIAALCETGVELAWYEISRLSGSFRHGAVEQFEALLTVGQGREPTGAAAPLTTAPEWAPPDLPDLPDLSDGDAVLGMGRVPTATVVGVHVGSFSQAAIEGVGQAGRLFDALGWGDRPGRFEVLDMSGKVVDGKRAEYRITLRAWPTAAP